MNTYKNETTENIKVRTGTIKNYIWKTIRPDEEIRLPWHTAESTELTDLGRQEKNQVTEEKYEEGASNEFENKEDQQAPGPLPTKEYKKELLAIDGVGPKYAKEIMEIYPTIEDLKAAVDKGEEIHNHDGVDEAVKKKFK